MHLKQLWELKLLQEWKKLALGRKIARFSWNVRISQERRAKWWENTEDGPLFRAGSWPDGTWHQDYISSCVYLRPHFDSDTSRGTDIYAFCFQSFCSQSNLHTSVFLKKDCLRGKRQTAAQRDAWRRRLAAGTANLGSVTGPTLRKKPPAAWHRWDAIELAHSFSSLIHADLTLIFFTIEGEWNKNSFIRNLSQWWHMKLKLCCFFLLPEGTAHGLLRLHIGSHINCMQNICSWYIWKKSSMLQQQVSYCCRKNRLQFCVTSHAGQRLVILPRCSLDMDVSHTRCLSSYCTKQLGAKTGWGFFPFQKNRCQKRNTWWERYKGRNLTKRSALKIRDWLSLKW